VWSSYLLFIVYIIRRRQKNFPCYDLTTVLKVEPTALYKPHLDASKSFGVQLLKDSKTVQKYINKGKFHKIKRNPERDTGSEA
jgi:Tfp pilus assembly ATPase PilU